MNKGRIGAGYRLQPGDRVRIPPLRLAERESLGQPGQRLLQQLELAILFEDRRLLVLDNALDHDFYRPVEHWARAAGFPLPG